METEILSMRAVTKRFPGVLALNSVDFTLRQGETHALVGANGAGKSTLIKILAGAYAPDEGEITLKGQKVKFQTPLEAQNHGIAVIYQEFNLFPELDIAKNIYFGREPRKKGGFVDWKSVYKMSAELMRKFGLDLDVETEVKNLSIAQQQMVEIAKALSFSANILVMDEPTAALTVREVEHLFKIIADLKKREVSVIYISHRLDEVESICDRLTVLRNGQVVGSAFTRDLSRQDIVRMMVGESIDNSIRANPLTDAPEVLSVKNLTNRHIKDVNFSLKKGEVLGIAGLVGAGRTELVRAIFGADRIDSGEIFLHGKKRYIQKPKDAIAGHIGLLPESRKEQGLFMNLNVRRNTTIANLGSFTDSLFISRQRELDVTKRQIAALRIKTPDTEFPVANLSGGNQQKVVISRWLCVDSDILILDEPTRGVDVGAKEEIFALIAELASKGKSILFISSELEEVLRVSGRILTMYKGGVTAVLNQSETNMDKIMYYITGGENQWEN